MILCVMRRFFFFFQAEDGIRDHCVTGVQTCALPICIEVCFARIDRNIAQYEFDPGSGGIRCIGDVVVIKVGAENISLSGPWQCWHDEARSGVYWCDELVERDGDLETTELQIRSRIYRRVLAGACTFANQGPGIDHNGPTYHWSGYASLS